MVDDNLNLTQAILLIQICYCDSFSSMETSTRDVLYSLTTDCRFLVPHETCPYTPPVHHISCLVAHTHPRHKISAGNGSFHSHPPKPEVNPEYLLKSDQV